MPTDPIQLSARNIDLSARYASTGTVAASPAASSITTIATLTIPGNLTIASGVWLSGWAAFTVGTSGVSAKLDIRQTNTTGAVIATTGATTVVAANLAELGATGFDASPLAAGVYVLCLTVGSGAASSAVSAVNLFALII